MKLATLITTFLLVLLSASLPADASKGGNGGGSPHSACNDGADNDADGLTDYPNDPGCASASDTDEYNQPPPCVTVADQCVVQCATGDFQCNGVAYQVRTTEETATFTVEHAPGIAQCFVANAAWSPINVASDLTGCMARPW